MKIATVILAVSVQLTLVAQAPPELESFFQPFQMNDAQRREIEAIEISFQQEKQLGDRAAQRYEKELAKRGVKIIRRGRDITYLTALVNRLGTQMTNAARYRTIRINLVDSDVFDARMFPGGTMFVFRGVLESLDSEAALVGVLGHELSHLDHGHQLFELRRQKLMASLPASASDPQKMMIQMQTMAMSFSRPHRPEEETAADTDGLKWAYAIGYDPRPFARVFRNQLRGNANDGNLFNFFASHPTSAQRSKAAEALCDELVAVHPAARRLVVGRENLLKRRPAR